MDTADSLIGETFGVKQDALVTGYTKILQGILNEKRIAWEMLTGTNLCHFFRTGSQFRKRWNKDELALFNEDHMNKWDTSICAKILLLENNLWGNHPPLFHSSKEKINAIEFLRTLRNNTKHRVQDDDITEREFQKNCNFVSHNLFLLDVTQEQIHKIIADASVLAVVDKNKVRTRINQLKETKWKFQTLQVLGCGSFGVVIRARDTIDKSESAIKIIPNRDVGITIEGNEDVIREAKHWAKLHHENIVQYKNSDYFNLWPLKLKEILDLEMSGKSILVRAEYIRACLHISEETKKIISGLYIQMEVCGPTLRSWLLLDSTPDSIRDEICGGLITGVNYLHSQDIIHRDLRPENIYFTLGSDFNLPIKIGDFGLSKQLLLENDFRSFTMSKDVGNLHYRAPEISLSHNDKPNMAKYGSAVDLFSVGLIIAEIYDPQQNNLAVKLNKIRYRQDTGTKIRTEYPIIDILILKLSNEDPKKRHDYDAFGRPMPISNMWGTSASAPISLQPSTLRSSKPHSQSPLLDRMENLSLTSEINGTHRSDYSGTAPYVPVPNFEPYDSGYSGYSDTRPINSDNIVHLRKLLQRHKPIWTDRNVADFFNYMENTSRHQARDFDPSGLRTCVNRNLYRILKDSPHLMTKVHIKSALRQSGFPTLADKIDAIPFA